MTTVLYDEDSNILCPVCQRPMSATIRRVHENVPCWMVDGEFSHSWSGHQRESKLVALVCSGCAHTVEPPFKFQLQEREKQLALA